MLRLWKGKTAGQSSPAGLRHDDTTNFYTYIASNNTRNQLAQRGHFHALSHCMLLPGPEAQQLAIYIGWKLHGKVGRFLAGTLFVLPSTAILLGLSLLYA